MPASSTRQPNLNYVLNSGLMSALKSGLISGLVFGAISLLPTLSHAQASDGGFMIGLSAMKFDSSTDGPNLGTTESSTTVLNIKAGYTMSSGLYFGGIYDSRTDETNGAKDERTGYGGTIGYHNQGWFIDGSYFISSTYKLSSGTELTEGSGYGIDLGKNFDLTSNIYLGLQISYKSFTYNKAGSVTATNKIKSELMPMLNLGVNF